MLVEKEVIAPGAYWYVDEKTGLPRKLDVTPELTRYWHEQGNKMLSAGLPVPVPYEHDFAQGPMTPKDKLLNNAGQVAEYRLKDDVLWSVVDVQDDDVKKKLGKSIRWTSPWITSFTDGAGQEWNNVIGHLALTTRPRVTRQAPFSSIAAALSLATLVDPKVASPREGFCLSRAGRLFTGKVTKVQRPRYPIAFSLWSGGVSLAEGEYEEESGGGDGKPPKKEKKKMPPIGDDLPDDEPDKDVDTKGGGEVGDMTNPLAHKTGDVKMEELLCDLLSVLGVMMPENCSESDFKRHLYEATMMKVQELAAKGQSQGDMGASPEAAGANTTSPAGGSANPLIKQEQPPMYMSLEEIQKITDPTMRTIALSMYNENVKLRAEMDAQKKVSESLRDKTLREAAERRTQRAAMLGRVSPKVKADLDAMLALPGMALSLGDGGAVIDPMDTTLSVLEKGLSDLPRLLTTEAASLSVGDQPTDAEALSQARADELADDMARRMGCPPEKKAS